MTQELIHSSEKDLEKVDFEMYRKICDSDDRFRKIGIQGRETYRRVCNDPRTVFVKSDFGYLPILSPLEYEKMYDSSKTKNLTDREEAFLLSLPLSRLSQFKIENALITLPEDAVIVVEEFVDISNVTSPAVDHKIPTCFDSHGANVYEFTNPDLIEYPENKEAWMAGYVIELGSDTDVKKQYRGSGFTSEVMEIWKNRRIAKDQPLEPTQDAKGVYYFSGDQLAERPDIIDGLWTISEHGFGKILGAHHPVAMEFNRSFFDTQVTDPDVMTAVYFENGEALCFSFISSHFNNNDWINCESSVMQHELFGEQMDGKVGIHWFELISKGAKGMGYSEKVMQEFMDLASAAGYEYKAFFESTNLSSLYIPDIARKHVQQTEGLIFKDLRIIDKLSYWAIVT